VKFNKSIILGLLLLSIFGCSQEAMMERLIPKEEVEFSKKYLSLFQSRNFEEISKPLNPQLKTEKLQSQLEQVAQFFPPDPPKNIELVGSNTFKSGDKWEANITFQYEFPSSWLIASINLERIGDGDLIVNGVNVNPIRDSLTNINKFTFKGKSPIHFIFLVLVGFLPLFIIFTFITCLRTPIKKRKWLWAIFVLWGYGQFSINWTTGVGSIKPFYFQLLGAGFMSAGKYAPWILSISIPLGAILFWIRKGEMAQKQETIEGQVSGGDAENSGDLTGKIFGRAAHKTADLYVMPQGGEK
jgi:hypothetical protein